MALDKDQIRDKIDTFLEQKVANLAPKIKAAIFAAAFVLPVGLFVYFVYMPRTNDIATLRSQQSALETEVAEVKATAADLEKHKAEMAQTGHLLELASVLLPKQKDIPSLLTHISDLGIKSGLEFVSFQPGAESPKEFYTEVPLTVSVSGPYHNVLNFLYQVSKLDRIVSATNVSMGGASFKGGENVLTTSLQFVTFKFVESAVAAPAP